MRRLCAPSPSATTRLHGTRSEPVSLWLAGSPQLGSRGNELSNRADEPGQLIGGQGQAERQVTARSQVIPAIEQIEEKQLLQSCIAPTNFARGPGHAARRMDRHQATHAGRAERRLGLLEQLPEFGSQ